MLSFGNAPQIRETVQPILSGQISHICEVSGLLAEGGAFSLMNSRLEVYGAVASQNPFAEGFHLRLKQALYEASATATPARSSTDKVSITDAFSDLELTKALVAWDMKRMPIMDGLLRAIAIK